MSTLIPSLGAARFDARGELRLAERLKDCLEDNAVAPSRAVRQARTSEFLK